MKVKYGSVIGYYPSLLLSRNIKSARVCLQYIAQVRNCAIILASQRYDFSASTGVSKPSLELGFFSY